MHESIQEVIQKGIRPLAHLVIHGKTYSFSNIFFALLFSSLLFFLFFYSLGKAVKADKKNKLAYTAEILYLMLRHFIRSKLGEKGDQHIPFIGTLFGYLLFCNLLGLFSPLSRLGLHWFVSPSIDLSVTLGAAATGILFVHANGIKNKGLKGYIGHYFQPYWLMFPINVVEEIVKPLSLSIRLFGNIFGEHVVYEITFFLISPAVPVIVMVLALFTGTIQAYVFSMLIIVYLSEMIGLHEKEGSQI